MDEPGCARMTSYKQRLIDHYAAVRQRLRCRPVRIGVAPFSMAGRRFWLHTIRLSDANRPLPAPNAPAAPAVSTIIEFVARRYGITALDIVSERRSKHIVMPRQIAMWLACVLTPFGTVRIGRRFGDRDHSTVMHARDKIARMIAADSAFAAEVEAIRCAIVERRTAKGPASRLEPRGGELTGFVATVLHPQPPAPNRYAAWFV